MQSPSIHILWEFNDGPWGGGNQFLKALRQEFSAMGCYADNPERADIILFNSHQHQKKALQLKRRFPKKIFVHRIDGPIALARGESGKKTDRSIFFCNRILADGTIFQSSWSRLESMKAGLKQPRFDTCISNAPDPSIFHPCTPEERKTATDSRIKLIATSWSSNPRKGFDIYHYLDKHLDFKRYHMTFVGNTDKPFTNIKIIEPLPSKQLADILRHHDIFIAASLMESCSNSFLEGLHSGLPAIARNNTSHPEILAGNGLLFNGTEDILEQIDTLASRLDDFRSKLKVRHISEIAMQYHRFCKLIKESTENKTYHPKKLSTLKYYIARIRLKTL
ncbi:glycosyltransferase [Prosthecochloris sp. CIB 2401]|uniref:glycosyltransferase n=1 Tax=Prosthecochloris sp. CIB 2401 TaxID=1868325 RepID=UPI00080AB264|nr:glycosyltransferase [Prosthecochloris sp. CIB 2401]ANT64147.1 putative group 1 glycosyl transferase [Prosthecochloris sp. CIB 2401]